MRVADRYDSLLAMKMNVATGQLAVKVESPVSPVCEIYSSLLDQVVALANVVETLGNDLARPSGQSLARWQVLATVGSEAAPVVVIAAALGHTRQSVQRIADALVQDELAHYRPNPAHQRAKLLEISPAGRAALQNMQKAKDLCTRRTASGLDATELVHVRQFLREVQHRIETELTG
ncbi:MarR family winged helix-turn-helix transcriptional regulator [Streptomyces asiaticus]